MKKLLIGLVLLASAYFIFIPPNQMPAWAQNVTCPTRPPGDSTNACASTAFVTRVLANVVNHAVAIGTSTGQLGSAGPCTAGQTLVWPGITFDPACGTAGLPSGTVLVTNAPYSAKCDGVTDDTVAIQSAINSSAAILLFPPAVCLIATSGTGLTGVGLQTWQGSGLSVTTIRANGNPNTDLIAFTGVHGFEIKDLTIDYNNKVPPGLAGAIGINTANTFAIRRVAVVHGNKLGITVTNSSSFTIEDSAVSRDSVINTLNQAMLFTDAAGQNFNFRVLRNSITNWGIINGTSSNCYFRENFITNYWYGAGISADVGTACIIEANIIVGGQNALDADSTRPGGIESNWLKSVIASNIIYNNGGSGIHAAGLYVSIANNLTFNNGTYSLVNPSFQFGGIESRWADSANNGHFHSITGNVSFDQTGTQAYGWANVPAGGGGNEPEYQTLAGNIFIGNVTPALTTTGIYRSFVGPALEGTVGVGGSTITAGTTQVITLTVNGSTLVDKVMAGINIDLQGLTLTGYVSAANTAKVVYYNGTGGNITLGAHTLNVTSFKAASAANY